MNFKNYSYYLSSKKSITIAQLAYLEVAKKVLLAKEDKGSFDVFIDFSGNLLFTKYAKLHLQFLHFCDLVCSDYPSKVLRFEITFILRKLVFHQVGTVFEFLRPRTLGQSLILKINAHSSEFMAVSSISSLFPASMWGEREAWDLYGVFFSGNSDLRRILTDYGFQGHPFRKDFPLSGYLELRYDYSKKRVVYEPVQLAQEFRLFDFTSPWIQK